VGAKSRPLDAKAPFVNSTGNSVSWSAGLLLPAVGAKQGCGALPAGARAHLGLRHQGAPGRLHGLAQ
jgi:hypothetical protein